VPGSQSFDIYDANFQTLFSGSSVVPEPQSLLLAIRGRTDVAGISGVAFAPEPLIAIA